MNNSIKIVTQNCFVSLPMGRVRQMVAREQADIYCLQEITGRRVAMRVAGMGNYTYLMSNPLRAIHVFKFHNVIVTRLPVVDAGELFFRKIIKRGLDSFAGKAFWAVLKYGRTNIKVYNCYLSPFGQGMVERRDLLVQIMHSASLFRGPSIICGDMNTCVPKYNLYRPIVQLWNRFPTPRMHIVGDFAPLNEKYYFHKTATQYGYNEIADLSASTWRMPFIAREWFNMKLDWFLYKNCDAQSYKFGPWIGDHRSIIGKLRV